MRLARVIGNIVSTIKDDGYHGLKLMIVEFFDPETKKTDGSRMIAFDCADAGVGDIVLVNTDGGAGNILIGSQYTIVDLTICGVIDSYCINGKNTFYRDGGLSEEDK